MVDFQNRAKKEEAGLVGICVKHWHKSNTNSFLCDGEFFHFKFEYEDWSIGFGRRPVDGEEFGHDDRGGAPQQALGAVDPEVRRPDPCEGRRGKGEGEGANQEIKRIIKYVQ